MKKGICLIFLVGLSAGHLFAGSSVGFGIKAGMDLAWQNLVQNGTGLPNVTREDLFAFNGAAFGELNLADFLSFQTEAGFIQKGISFNFNNFPVVSSGGTTLGTTSVTTTETYNYIEVPLLIKTKAVLGPHWKGYFLTGPSIAFLLAENDTITQNASGNVPYSQISTDGTKAFPNIDWSLVFGAGVEYQNFLLEIRYELGLTSAAPNLISDRSLGQNNALCFQFGYRLL